MWSKYVIDATLGESPWEPHLYTYVPVELDDDGEIKSVVTGMMQLGFYDGDLLGVWHEDGMEAVNAWVDAHPNWKEIAAKDKRPDKR